MYSKTKKIIIMRILFIAILLITHNVVKSQEKEYDVCLSITETLIIDSISVKSPPLHLNKTSALKFENIQVETPENAVQAFISFTSNEWGKSLASTDYPDYFPSSKTIEHRKSKTYLDNIYAKIFFAFYFTYNNNTYAGCYVESFATEEYPVYYTTFIFKQEKNKWLLADDWFLSRVDDVTVLKPKYAVSLFQGKKIEGNNEYMRLYNKVYHKNAIDLGILKNELQNNLSTYKPLLN
jgi:hypothetical protein